MRMEKKLVHFVDYDPIYHLIQSYAVHVILKQFLFKISISIRTGVYICMHVLQPYARTGYS